MKLFSNHMRLMALMAFAAVLFGSAKAQAQSALSIPEPVVVAGQEVVNIPVDFTKGNPVVGMQFDIALPDFMEFADAELVLTDRLLPNRHHVQFNKYNGRVLIWAGGQASEITGESGPLLYIPAKVKSTAMNPETGKIAVSGITFSGASTGTVTSTAPTWAQDNFSATVEYNPYSYTFSGEPATVVLHGGTSAQLGINLDNSYDVIGFQMNLTLPAGVTIEPNDIALGSRCPAGSTVDIYNRPGNVTNIVYLGGDNRPLYGESGTVLTLTLNAAESFIANAADIRVDDIIVSYGVGKSVNADPFTVAINNDKAAYDRLSAVISKLEADFAQALQTIATDCPDVKEAFTGEAISNQIAALKTKVTDMMATGTLTANEAALTNEAGNIATAISTLVSEAKAAEAAYKENLRVQANTAAYNASLAELDALEAKLTQTLAQAAQAYPNANVATQKSAAEQAIADARAAAKNALDAVATAGTYNYNVPADAINAAIDAVTDAAKAGQAAYDEAQRVAANDAAHKEVLARLDALRKQLADVAAAAATAYPNADVTAEKTAAETAISNAQTAANTAFEAVAKEGTYKYTVDTAAIEALIAAVTDAAKAGQAAYDETQRVAANDAAHKAVLAQLDALRQQLDNVVKSVTEIYPNADVTAEKTAAATAISNAQTAANAALAAVANGGVYSYNVDTAAIETLIAAVTDAAKAGQASYDEAQRVASNEAAYNAALAQIEALRQKLAQTLAVVSVEYPNANVSNETAAVNNAISNAENKADIAYLAVASKGLYNYTVDSESILALIDALLDAAKAGQAAYDEAQRVAANEAAYKAVLDEIEALRQQLAATVASAAKLYPNADVTTEKTAAETALNNAQSAAEAAYKAVEKEGTFNYTVDTASLEKLFNAVTDAAKAGQAAYDEAQRVAANEAAHNAVLAQLSALKQQLDETLANVDKEYPHADVTAETEAAQSAIADAEKKANSAFESVATEGVYDYEVDMEAIEALIAAIPVAAEKSEAEWAEAERVAANEEAYNKVLDEIETLRGNLADALEEVAEKYPWANVDKEKASAENAINKAADDAKKAYEAVAEEGTFDYTLDVKAIEALIDKIVDSASKQDSIESIEAEAIDGNIMVYTLNGVRVLKPQAGQICIVVRDGKTSKVIFR